MQDKYITPVEMQGIISLCEAMDKFYETAQSVNGLSLGDEVFGETMEVYDSNGDVLGHIGFAEEGYALYLPDTEEKIVPHVIADRMV